MSLHGLFSTLMPYLGVLYLADCLAFVRGGQFALASATGKGFRLVGPGLRILGFFPSTWVLMCRDVPVPVTAEGVYAPRVWGGRGPRPWRPEDFEFIPRGDDATASASGASLRLGGRSFPLANGPAAGELARTIGSVLGEGPSPADFRARIAVEEAASFEGLQGELQKAREILRPLAFSSTAIFIGFFLFLPSVLYVRALVPAVVPLVALLAGIYVLTLALFWRAHARLLPGDREGRLEILATLILLPVGAAHAVSKVTRGLFARYDWPLHAALLAPEEAGAVFRKEILRTGYSAARGGSADLTAYWRSRESVLRRAAAAAGLRIEAAAPSEGAADDGPACPLCESRYREDQNVCADCDVPLVR